MGRAVLRGAGFLCILLAIGAAAPDASEPIPLRGVNLSGAELNSTKLPGRLNFDYVYPTAAELDYVAAHGMTVIRLPVLWERLQPKLDQALDARELGHLLELVQAAQMRGLSVIIDLHNYGAYRGQRIGTAAVSNASFADMWSRMAQEFAGRPGIIFGIMNEPNGVDAKAWFVSAQAALNAIRQAGFRGLVLVPGTGWDGAHNFVSGAGYGTPNAAVLGQLQDPDNDVAIEVHQYLDADSSGTHPDCLAADQAASLLKPFASWLRATRRRGFLGEFGVSRAPRCLEALAAMLRSMAKNPDVWVGWSYFAGGPWWSRDYMFSAEPVDGQDRPQMRVLQAFLDKPAVVGRQP